MASKAMATTALLLALNLLFCTMITANHGGHKKKNPKGSNGKCPIDTLKLGVCANVLNGLLNVTIGQPPKEPCCSLLGNLLDLEAAVCLCTAIKANILGINLNVPVDLSLLLNYCGKNVPKKFQCA